MVRDAAFDVLAIIDGPVDTVGEDTDTIYVTFADGLPSTMYAPSFASNAGAAPLPNALLVPSNGELRVSLVWVGLQSATVPPNLVSVILDIEPG